jgi:hypothetical protein
VEPFGGTRRRIVCHVKRTPAQAFNVTAQITGAILLWRQLW